jgi:hypothetical protein
VTILSSVGSWPDYIEGGGWFRQLSSGNLRDLGDSLAQVGIIQFDIDLDPIALAICWFKIFESATGIVQVCPVLVWNVIVCWT